MAWTNFRVPDDPGAEQLRSALRRLRGPKFAGGSFAGSQLLGVMSAMLSRRLDLSFVSLWVEQGVGDETHEGKEEAAATSVVYV
jgi:hypothetical protein